MAGNVHYVLEIIGCSIHQFSFQKGVLRHESVSSEEDCKGLGCDLGQGLNITSSVLFTLKNSKKKKCTLCIQMMHLTKKAKRGELDISLHSQF